ncbi:MAG: hypothetical protein LBP34_05385 [Flavobacteriaceae bacterium]|jgi:hypothetical protein|nr:hypothetical protein [Flavobacteriaceae bacterium]
MKALLTIITLFLSVTTYAQTYKFYQTDNINNQLRLNSKTGEVYQIQNDGQTFLVHPATTPNNEKPNRYTLYKTQNMWTYILIDKFLGKLWQCQYSVEGTEYISSWVINPYSLSYSESNKFMIQPLTSMYQFYLINDETGDMWKFQWSTEGDEYRWIEKM